MNKEKAEKRIRRKAARVKSCPFCGAVPEFEFRVDEKHSSSGSIGHYAARKRCCPATGLGQTELFFCNNHKKPDYGLWWSMASRLMNDWNRRL